MVLHVPTPYAGNQKRIQDKTPGFTHKVGKKGTLASFNRANKACGTRRGKGRARTQGYQAGAASTAAPLAR